MVRQNKAYKTAIQRKQVSVPARWLEKHGLLNGRILDYGCGQGYDCTWLDCDGYDPYYQPAMPDGLFDTVICNYVLNVIPENEWNDVINGILQKLKSGGVAYITVRNDRRHLNGWTSRQTYQTMVDLVYPIIYQNSFFRIYKVQV